MAACSDYFRVMLTGSMRESREQCVELKGVTAGGLKVCCQLSSCFFSSPYVCQRVYVGVDVTNTDRFLYGFLCLSVIICQICCSSFRLHVLFVSISPS